jgi:hypothetical protein
MDDLGKAIHFGLASQVIDCGSTNPGTRCFAVPVALQFENQLNPTSRLAACLFEPPQTRFVRLNRAASADGP